MRMVHFEFTVGVNTPMRIRIQTWAMLKWGTRQQTGSLVKRVVVRCSSVRTPEGDAVQIETTHYSAFPGGGERGNTMCLMVPPGDNPDRAELRERAVKDLGYRDGIPFY